MAIRKNKDGNWEYRVWIPITEETTAPTISVVEFEGTWKELLDNFFKDIFESAEEKDIGKLASIAFVLLEEVRDIEK